VEADARRARGMGRIQIKNQTPRVGERPIGRSRLRGLSNACKSDTVPLGIAGSPILAPFWRNCCLTESCKCPCHIMRRWRVLRRSNKPSSILTSEAHAGHVGAVGAAPLGAQVFVLAPEVRSRPIVLTATIMRASFIGSPGFATRLRIASFPLPALQYLTPIRTLRARTFCLTNMDTISSGNRASIVGPSVSKCVRLGSVRRNRQADLGVLPLPNFRLGAATL
jgi:hypothetical protein